MNLWLYLFFLAAPIDVAESADFPKPLQVRAISATVRIHNPTRKAQGSGVIVGVSGGFVYVLTAHHIVQETEALEIEVFSEKSYPAPEKVYRNARIVAKSPDLRDLMLLRMVAGEDKWAYLPICPLADVPMDSLAALSVGCADNHPPTASVGKVGKKKARAKGGESGYFWEWEGRAAAGRSGGPLIDKRGHVIGICSGISGGKGYFTHIDEIHRFLKKNAFRWLTEGDK